jgi:hypothetical protein
MACKASDVGCSKEFHLRTQRVKDPVSTGDNISEESSVIFAEFKIHNRKWNSVTISSMPGRRSLGSPVGAQLFP